MTKILFFLGLLVALSSIAASSGPNKKLYSTYPQVFAHKESSFIPGTPLIDVPTVISTLPYHFLFPTPVFHSIPFNFPILGEMAEAIQSYVASGLSPPALS